MTKMQQKEPSISLSESHCSRSGFEPGSQRWQAHVSTTTLRDAKLSHSNLIQELEMRYLEGIRPRACLTAENKPLAWLTAECFGV